MRAALPFGLRWRCVSPHLFAVSPGQEEEKEASFIPWVLLQPPPFLWHHLEHRGMEQDPLERNVAAVTLGGRRAVEGP